MFPPYYIFIRQEWQREKDCNLCFLPPQENTTPYCPNNFLPWRSENIEKNNSSFSILFCFSCDNPAGGVKIFPFDRDDSSLPGAHYFQTTSFFFLFYIARIILPLKTVSVPCHGIPFPHSSPITVICTVIGLDQQGPPNAAHNESPLHCHHKTGVLPFRL